MADSTNKPPVDLIGQRLFGTYTVTEKLGQGAMGNVFLAQQSETGQRIAIKLLNEEAATNEETVARFLREARVISMLTHPNVVRVFIFGETPAGVTYMAMEHVDGVPLDRVVRNTPLAHDRVVRITRQMLGAIGEAHELGVMHRDLKPENVLLTTWRGEKDFVKILDFGIAKVQNANQQLTQTGIVYGTPAYMSPEQAQAHDIDRRADLYSLGCMMYEMATGKLPFDAKSNLKVLEMQAFQTPTPPSELAKVDPRLEAVILRAMAKKPDDRFQSAEEMLAALDALDAPAPTNTPVSFQMLNDLAASTTWFWPVVLLTILGLAALCVLLLAIAVFT